MAPGFDSLRAALADRYEIERELGEGGMATVYLAEDLKHERQVAIKVLKPDLAAVIGAERFLAEIKTTANLQHPHILALHDSGEANGFLYYVMPYVKGESLRDRLDRERQLPVGEAVRIAVALSNALQTAHEGGVVHRDIKPGNILLSRGEPLLADFGIALAVESGGGARLTETGMSVGTPHYMSPEQAAGDQEVGPKSDIYSLGAVTYEALTGEPPFSGTTPQAILARILTEEPSRTTQLRRTVPGNVDAAVLTALQRVPADRFGTAAEFGEALEDQAFAGAPGIESHTLNGRPARRRTTAVLAGALTIAIASGAWGWLRPTAGTAPVRALPIRLPELPRIHGVTISPMGDHVAFESDGRLWVQRLDGLSVRDLPGTEGGVNPFWSPDGESLGFFFKREVMRVRLDGGEPARIMTMDRECATPVCGGDWTDDGRVLVGDGVGGILWAPEGGGPAAVLIPHTDDEHFHQPRWLPGGAVVVEVDPDVGGSRLDLWDGENRRVLAEGAYDPVYSSEGFILYSADGSVWAAPYSEGDPPSVGERFLVFPDPSSERYGRFVRTSAADDGTLLVTRSSRSDPDLVWVDRNGVVREPVVTGEERTTQPRLSPSGSTIAYVEDQPITTAEQIPSGRVWTLNPSTGARGPLELDADRQLSPAWSPDGSTIYYSTLDATTPDDEDAVIRAQALTSAGSRVIVERARAASMSWDGKYLAYMTGAPDATDILYLDLGDADPRPRPFQVGPPLNYMPTLSPTDDVMAYLHSDFGLMSVEIYVSRFPGGEERALVSRGGVEYNTLLRWSRDGTKLYYARSTDGALMEVEVGAGNPITLSEPRALFREMDSNLRLDFGFDVNQDGTRFLVTSDRPLVGSDPAGVILIQNWLSSARAASSPR
jgi:serine/threonine-protein kinase